MGKVETLKMLHDRGLNTPEMFLDLKQFEEDKKQKWRDFYADAVDNRIGKVSIRTERDGEVKCPFFPNVNMSRVSHHVVRAIEAGYRIMVFKAINPVDSLHCGNVAHTGDEIVTEWIDGAGTCRDLETSSKINHLKIPIQQTSVFRTTSLVQSMLSEIIYRIKPKEIIEWSIYPYPVGTLQKETIYWEIRPWQ